MQKCERKGSIVKRALLMLTVCLLSLGMFVLPASAESAASRVESQITVSAEGDCFVTTTATLRMEAINNGLTFPLPASAANITVNSAPASTIRTASATQVDISRLTGGMTGEFSILFSYTLPDAVKPVKINEGESDEAWVLQLELPLLSGFELPVETLSFVVNMPSAKMTHSPVFTSTYRQSSVASDLNVKIDGTQIIGASKVTMNDHDGVTMTMQVPQEMFPTISTYVREGNPELIPMLICVALALAYWLIFLRCAPLIRRRSSTAPAGITAGEMGCRLTLAGADLTMMVFSWAQMGYLMILPDGRGKVLLQKRMDMGNERSAFENKVFRLLFGSRQMVDATGNQYARLCHKVTSIVPSERSVNKNNPGNMKLYRALCCGMQIFAGINVAMNMAASSALQVILSVILSVFGAVSAWLIQDVAYRTHLRGKVPVYIGLVCILLWIGLGLLSGMVWIPMGAAFGQMVLGYFAAYGGRRSELGRSDAGQILGLRSYLKNMPREELGRLMDTDPEYFFHLAPYALALGVIKPYANAFSRRKIDSCPYLSVQTRGRQTAEDWGQLLADTADLMDARSRKLMVEKWIPTQLPKSLPRPKNAKPRQARRTRR